MLRRSILSAAAATVLLWGYHALAQGKKEEAMITKGSVVSFDYTLSDDQGNVIESTQGKQPFTYTHGQGQIIPGLENGLAGMKVEETKNIRVQPEEAYGIVNPKRFQEVTREKIPAEGLKVGATLYAQGPQGQTFPVRVHEVKEKTVVLDFNHPLAGKTLTFDVKIVGIKPSENK